MSGAEARPFGKYERYGAYHWREIGSAPTSHNAVLTARYEVLLKAIEGRPARVLDVGCGDGTLTFRLASLGAGVVGLDDAMLPLKLARVEISRRRPVRAPLLLQADAQRLPFGEGAFDCVVLADVIEHIPAPDAVIDEACRVLEPGGQIVVTTPRRQGETPAHEYHCVEYTAPELARLLGRRFRDVRVQPFQPARVARLYHTRVLGRKFFRVGINCLAIAGWNPLAVTGELSAEPSHTDLCATARKA